MAKKMLKITRNILPILLVSVCFSGCQKETDTSPSQYPPRTFSFLDKVSDDEKLPELKLIGNDTEVLVTSCRELLGYINKLTLVETDNNFRSYAYYQPCIASLIYKEAQAANLSFYDEDFSSVIHKKLDLASFRSSIRPKLDDNVHSFIELGYKHSGDTNVVDIDRRSWRYRFTLLARGDFNGDKIEDLLVNFLDESKSASYYSNTTLVLIKPQKGMLWRAEEAENYIK